MRRTRKLINISKLHGTVALIFNLENLSSRYHILQLFFTKILDVFIYWISISVVRFKIKSLTHKRRTFDVNSFRCKFKHKTNAVCVHDGSQLIKEWADYRMINCFLVQYYKIDSILVPSVITVTDSSQTSYFYFRIIQK